LVDIGKNVLIMIKKEDVTKNTKFTPKEKFDELCKIFPEETKTGKIIISTIPDVIAFHEIDI